MPLIYSLRYGTAEDEDLGNIYLVIPRLSRTDSDGFTFCPLMPEVVLKETRPWVLAAAAKLALPPTPEQIAASALLLKKQQSKLKRSEAAKKAWAKRLLA
jgi:hypothetical protein